MEIHMLARMVRRCCEIKAGVVERDPKEQGERALLTDAQRTRILEEILEGEAAINPSLTRNLPHIKKSKPRNTREAA